ncbi:MAG: hypothetical protein WBX49_05245 [Candidatus Deferrimicrobiaceae bacterium]
MSFMPNAFAPELRELEKSTLNQMHATMHQKEMRNSDRLLIFSTLIDRYIETRTSIVMNMTGEGEGQRSE